MDTYMGPGHGHGHRLWNLALHCQANFETTSEADFVIGSLQWWAKLQLLRYKDT
jgi:hypothetical protein